MWPFNRSSKYVTREEFVLRNKIIGQDIGDIYKRLSALEVPRINKTDPFIDGPTISAAGDYREAFPDTNPSAVLKDAFNKEFDKAAKKTKPRLKAKGKSDIPKGAKPGDKYIVEIPGKFMSNPDDDVPPRHIVKTVPAKGKSTRRK